ncbi:MAG: TolB family protein [Blastocatellia bacterium]
MKALLIATIFLPLSSHANECSCVDQAQAQRLTSNKRFPQWSHDGKRIVFTSDRFRAITPGAANDQIPNWSRDGKRLLFYSDGAGKNQIYTMKPDGAAFCAR